MKLKNWTFWIPSLALVLALLLPLQLGGVVAPRQVGEGERVAQVEQQIDPTVDKKEQRKQRRAKRRADRKAYLKAHRGILTILTIAAVISASSLFALLSRVVFFPYASFFSVLGIPLVILGFLRILFPPKNNAKNNAKNQQESQKRALKEAERKNALADRKSALQLTKAERKLRRKDHRKKHQGLRLPILASLGLLLGAPWLSTGLAVTLGLIGLILSFHLLLQFLVPSKSKRRQAIVFFYIILGAVGLGLGAVLSLQNLNLSLI